MMQLRVNVLLQEQKKTPYWLSKQTGISQNNIGKICRGETTNIRLDTIEKICTALKCTPNDLMESDNKQLHDLMIHKPYGIILGASNKSKSDKTNIESNTDRILQLDIEQLKRVIKEVNALPLPKSNKKNVEEPDKNSLKSDTN